MFLIMEQENTPASGPARYVLSVLQRLKDSGLSEAEVCRRAGIAQTTLMRLKFGHSVPKVDTMEKLERVLEAHASR